MNNICTKQNHVPSCLNQAQEYLLELLVLSKEYNGKMNGREEESITRFFYLA